jgi:hypothetical protein
LQVKDFYWAEKTLDKDIGMPPHLLFQIYFAFKFFPEVKGNQVQRKNAKDVVELLFFGAFESNDWIS